MATMNEPSSPPPDAWARIVRFGPVLVVVFCAALLVLVGLIRPFRSPSPEIELRDVLVGADHDPTGAYFILRNAGGPDTLQGATTPIATSVDLQRPSSDPNGGLVTVTEIRIPGFEELRFQPGGDQLLLRGVTGPLAVGQRVPLTLQFERSGTVQVEAVVEPYETIADRLLPPRLKVADGS